MILCIQTIIQELRMMEMDSNVINVENALVSHQAYIITSCQHTWESGIHVDIVNTKQQQNQT